jgi:hypothetical protein
VRFVQPPVTSSLFGPNILLSALFSNTLSLCFFLMSEIKFHTSTNHIVLLLACVNLQLNRDL